MRREPPLFLQLADRLESIQVELGFVGSDQRMPLVGLEFPRVLNDSIIQPVAALKTVSPVIDAFQGSHDIAGGILDRPLALLLRWLEDHPVCKSMKSGKTEKQHNKENHLDWILHLLLPVREE